MRRPRRCAATPRWAPRCCCPSRPRWTRRDGHPVAPRALGRHRLPVRAARHGYPAVGPHHRRSRRLRLAHEPAAVPLPAVVRGRRRGPVHRHGRRARTSIPTSWPSSSNSTARASPAAASANPGPERPGAEGAEVASRRRRHAAGVDDRRRDPAPLPPLGVVVYLGPARDLGPAAGHLDPVRADLGVADVEPEPARDATLARPARRPTRDPRRRRPWSPSAAHDREVRVELADVGQRRGGRPAPRRPRTAPCPRAAPRPSGPRAPSGGGRGSASSTRAPTRPARAPPRPRRRRRAGGPPGRNAPKNRFVDGPIWSRRRIGPQTPGHDTTKFLRPS